MYIYIHTEMTYGVCIRSQLEGMCFRRIMWGHAAHILYAHTRLKLGTLVSDFARHHLRHFYDMSFPEVFASTDRGNSAGGKRGSRGSPVQQGLTASGPSGQAIAPVATNSSSMESDGMSGIGSNISTQSTAYKTSILPTAWPDGNTLRVVLFSREGDGFGRTLLNERKIVTFLNTLEGVQAVMCCDFKAVSFDRQLAMAYHADVVSRCVVLLRGESCYVYCGALHLPVSECYLARYIHSIYLLCFTNLYCRIEVLKSNAMR